MDHQRVSVPVPGGFKDMRNTIDQQRQRIVELEAALTHIERWSGVENDPDFTDKQNLIGIGQIARIALAKGE
jgi:hypothetical protein